jgi:hypothetical protein
VATTLDQESYKLMNGKENYKEWFFVAGQPRAFGKLVLPSGAPGVPPPPNIPIPPGGNRDPGRNRN